MKKIAQFVAFMLFFASCAAYADGFKVGIIDMNQVLQKSPLMVALNDNLTKKFTPRQDELNMAKKQAQDEVDQLNLKGDTMSADDRAKLQNKVVNDKANVQILDASFQRDLTIEKNKGLQTFMDKLSGVIKKIAEDGRYDIIEQRSNFIFVNNSLDITAQVLQQMK